MNSEYARAGVNYDLLDTAKRAALTAASGTGAGLATHGGHAYAGSWGEPAFVFSLGEQCLAMVMEGLGTKSLLAAIAEREFGLWRYDAIAVDTVAAITNDLACVGALPLVVNAYVATGGSDWYAHPRRGEQLVEGWRAACARIGATWGGGESPSLADLVAEDQVELAGCALGQVPAGQEPLLGAALAPGDRIVLLGSDGIHANGLSLARRVAPTLPDGWATALPDGTPLIQALLTPSVLYAPLLAALYAAGVSPTYCSHITGHGWRKLMRADRALRYRLDVLPPVPPVLEALAGWAGLTAQQAYATFNMGAGFAIYCRADDVDDVLRVAADEGFAAIDAGVVADHPRREVHIAALEVTYGHQDLALR